MRDTIKSWKKSIMGRGRDTTLPSDFPTPQSLIPDNGLKHTIRIISSRRRYEGL